MIYLVGERILTGIGDNNIKMSRDPLNLSDGSRVVGLVAGSELHGVDIRVFG